MQQRSRPNDQVFCVGTEQTCAKASDEGPVCGAWDRSLPGISGTTITAGACLSCQCREAMIASLRLHTGLTFVPFACAHLAAPSLVIFCALCSSEAMAAIFKKLDPRNQRRVTLAVRHRDNAPPINGHLCVSSAASPA